MGDKNTGVADSNRKRRIPFTAERFKQEKRAFIKRLQGESAASVGNDINIRGGVFSGRMRLFVHMNILPFYDLPNGLTKEQYSILWFQRHAEYWLPIVKKLKFNPKLEFIQLQDKYKKK